MWYYAVLAPILLRGKIIRRNVCTAVAYGDSWGDTLSTGPAEPVLYFSIIIFCVDT